MKFPYLRPASRCAMIALIAAMAAGNTYAAKKKTDDAPQQRTKSEYQFKLKQGTPEGMSRYSLTLYPYLDSKVLTLQGHQVADVATPSPRLYSIPRA